MKKAEMKPFKETLLAVRARLRGDVTQMANTALNKNGDSGADHSAMPIHMADIGTDAYEQEFTLYLVQNEEDTLGAIEVALEKIEDGVYGTCDECGGRINKPRLRALPYTPFCIDCANELER